MLFVSDEDRNWIVNTLKKKSEDELLVVANQFVDFQEVEELLLEKGEIMKEVRRRGCESRIGQAVGRDSWKEVFRSDGA